MYYTTDDHIDAHVEALAIAEEEAYREDVMTEFEPDPDRVTETDFNRPSTQDLADQAFLDDLAAWEGMGA